MSGHFLRSTKVPWVAVALALGTACASGHLVIEGFLSHEFASSVELVVGALLVAMFIYLTHHMVMRLFIRQQGKRRGSKTTRVSSGSRHKVSP
jgi:formate hydrogenlyase subunit 3/multisubunit Na+/H+ antiporter MnhD subunit